MAKYKLYSIELNEETAVLAENHDYACIDDNNLFILSKKKIEGAVVTEKTGNHIPGNVKEWLSASEIEIMRESLNSPKSIKAVKKFAADFEAELEKALADEVAKMREGDVHGGGETGSKA